MALTDHERFGKYRANLKGTKHALTQARDALTEAIAAFDIDKPNENVEKSSEKTDPKGLVQNAFHTDQRDVPLNCRCRPNRLEKGEQMTVHDITYNSDVVAAEISGGLIDSHVAARPIRDAMREGRIGHIRIERAKYTSRDDLVAIVESCIVAAKVPA
jgi:hypothetical protein